MPRQKGQVIENKFIKGLVTENTALSFPKDACTETWNCVFDYTGRVTRRKGFDLEANYVEDTTLTLTGNEAWTDYHWTNVNGDVARSYFIQQIGGTLYLFQTTNQTSLGVNKNAYTVDLADFLPDGSEDDPGLYPCQFAQGRGNLVIVNQTINPVVLQFDVETGGFTATTITIQARDFEGVDDGLTLTERITKTVATLITDNPSHYYNLLNQGWASSDALSQWDTARTDMPSNSDMVGYYRGSSTDAFDNARVAAVGVGNSPAIKGHFILGVGELDRTAAMAAEGFIATVPGGSALVSTSAGTIFGDFTFLAGSSGRQSSINRAFDGLYPGLFNQVQTGVGAFGVPVYAQNATCAVRSESTSGYIGKDWGSGVTRVINRVIFTGTSNKGFSATSNNPSSSSAENATLTFTLYGSNSSPVSATDGTSLSTTTFSNNSVSYGSSQTLTSASSTAYRYHWLTCTSGSTTTMLISEIQFYVGGTTFNRPRCTSFFTGRVWYAGVDSLTESSTIYFSQIINDETQYGKCYQKNDPTSEEISDLLDDDGGAIRIPEIGKVEKLFPFQGQMLIFASNGIWLVKGGAGGFKATDYQVKRITNVGVSSAYSFVDVQGIPVWWGEDNIYTVTYDPNYDSVTAKSLSENVIQNFYQDIPPINRVYAKGSHDKLNDTIYWVYNDSDDFTSTDYYTYNKVLCFNTKTSAFYPWTISNGNPSDVVVHGVTYIQDGTRVDEFKMKYPITYTRSATTYLSFADQISETYQDWTVLSSEVSLDDDDQIDYDSYFISGFRINAELLRNFQAMYIMVFLEDQEDASAFLQGYWDFANDGSSGKWSTTQQCYPMNTANGRDYRSVKHRRLKMRGKGKALQLKFSSETGKPFTMIGWGTMETANADI